MARIYLITYKRTAELDWEHSITSNVTDVHEVLNRDSEVWDVAVFALDQLPRIVSLQVTTQEQWQFPAPVAAPEPVVAPDAPVVVE